jgi:hypothetical protein
MARAKRHTTRLRGGGREVSGAERGPYTGLECGAKRAASRLGLWVLFGEPADDPQWSVFSRGTGRVVLTYYPRSRRWFCGQDQGRCEGGYREAFERAAGFRKCSENHNLH